MMNEKKCPICGKPADEKYKPFCCKKCADIDLGRWLKGNYVIHTNEAPKKEMFDAENDEEK